MPIQPQLAAAKSPVGALCGLRGEAEIEDRGGKQI